MRTELDLRDRLKELRLRLAMLFIDTLLMAYLWLIGNVSVSLTFFGAENYELVPAVWMIPFIIVAVSLWESFGKTAGMVIIRRYPMNAEEAPPTIQQRLLHWIGWFAFPIGIVTSLLNPYGNLPAESISGIFYTEPRSDMIMKPRPWYRTSLGLIVFVTGLFTLAAAVGITGASVIKLINGAAKTGKFWRDLINPDTSLFALGLKLLVETFFMAMIATMAAVLVAAPLSFFAARNLTHGIGGKIVYTLIRVLISAMRSIDALVWAIIFALWVGMGTFAGALALFIHSVADLLKLYSEQLEGIDQGPLEAVASTGGNNLQVIRYGIIPQIMNPYLSFTLYRWDINVRMATIVGMVGGGGIGWRLFSYLKAWQFRQASPLMLEILILVWVIDYVSSKMRARVESGASGQMKQQLRLQRPRTVDGPT